MIKVIPMLVALTVALGGSSSAEIIEVPLPTLQGWYGIDGACICYGDADFQLVRVPMAIDGVSIRLSGTVHVGQYSCKFLAVPHTYPYRFYFSASMRDTVSGFLWGADDLSGEESGEFELVASFEQLSSDWPVTWDFLMAGYGRVNLTAMPDCILVDCDVLDWPSATIEEATLLIEGEFAVSVDRSTWGSIKALFK
jgi:hypothetical protein